MIHAVLSKYLLFPLFSILNFAMSNKLFMVLIGCKPAGRHTEQHDIFFGIAPGLRDLIPEMQLFWPEAKGNMHVDGWREVTQVDGQAIKILPRSAEDVDQKMKLFFINLGGYKKDEFEEFHYKILVAASDKAAAIKAAKKTAFFKHTHFEGANSHVDDKYGIDVDDLYTIDEVLSADTLSKYKVLVEEAVHSHSDTLHLGYFKLSTL